MIMTELRERTKDLHRRTESAVDLLNRLDSIDSYVQLLCRFYGLYSPLEGRISDFLVLHPIRLDWQHQPKANLLVEDLTALGMTSEEIAGIPICSRLPVVNTLDRALGCLYVLEGSTLGGQIIRREVESRLKLTAETGCRFFTGYGPQTAISWRTFCSTLDAHASEHGDGREEIIKAAEDTFRRFGEWVAC